MKYHCTYTYLNIEFDKRITAESQTQAHDMLEFWLSDQVPELTSITKHEKWHCNFEHRGHKYLKRVEAESFDVAYKNIKAWLSTKKPVITKVEIEVTKFYVDDIASFLGIKV